MNLRRFVSRIFNFFLGESRCADRVYCWIRFLFIHRRLPTKKLIFNDVLYRIASTKEILNPLRVFISDKEFIKIYVKALVGDKYNIPTIAILDNKDQIDSFDYPDVCCIKPTHASGMVIIKLKGESINRHVIKEWLSVNYYRFGREANYKSLKPKIIIEPIIFGDKNVCDFKFFCFNGEPRLVQVDIDRRVNHTRKFFDTNWKELDFSIIYPKSDKPFVRPNNFCEMLSVAKALSKNFKMIRVDLYSDGVQIYVGELTNVSENFGGNFIPPKAEIEASKLLFGSSWSS